MNTKQLENLGIHVEGRPEWELDVVCGMDVETSTTPYRHAFKNKEYYFCNESCLTHFINDPDKYAL